MLQEMSFKIIMSNYYYVKIIIVPSSVGLKISIDIFNKVGKGWKKGKGREHLCTNGNELVTKMVA